ncbi:MAG TPA: glycosyl hydrolase [Chloroflexota bacterium]|nr:glycosyl hydrolase [Chloroflexota bacterium]
MTEAEIVAEQKSVGQEIPNEHLKGLEYRNIGPHRGGRVVAVAGHPRDPKTFYFGAVAGGVWKTEDAGSLWECATDGYLTTASVGALAISDADPNVIYAGTGETTIRGDVSHGDGVYRSTDGGKTWSNLGLRDTRHTARIRIHPQNPDLVYVAALGHAWGPNEERGLYRSKDGGASWERILFRSNRAGAIDLSMDPQNPRILYCAFWEAQRTPYSMWSGGPGSSLYRSTDGGDSWTEITRNEGLPQGVLGKIGVAVSPARSGRVWALIEAENGALFRSDDGGERWKRVSDNPDLRRRAWYYMHIYADPQDADAVWVLNLQAWRSTDGGVTFNAVPTPHGDNHDLWIDPANPQRLIEGNDGGACVSFNGGCSWSTILNQPTAQFYHVTADSSLPYRVYGSQQDNTAISVPSQSVHGAITQTDWFVPGGGESGYIAVRPDDPNIQYAGDHRGLLTRHDRRTGQERVIDVWPDYLGMHEGAESRRYRFQWTFPIFVSPFDPNVLYAAGNHLFRSTDEGGSWEAISPDLTRADPNTLQPSGGPITRDNTSAEVYATIFAAVESPHERGTFWVGTDDGLVHISRDDGKTWQEVTPPDLKSPQGEWALISIIDVSAHDPATAYVAATRYKLDDTRPYLYKTADYGTTWTKITNGIPEWDFTRVIREDPHCKGLLYTGTETGLYVSFDDGKQWEALQTNLPVCPIHDLIVHNDDLIVGTHGRSFWILDDVTPLHELARDRGQRNRLFRPRDTIRFKVYEGFGGGEGEQVMYRMAGPLTYAYRQEEKPNGIKETRLLDAGKNPPNGVIITYHLAAPPQGDIALAILDAAGNEVRRFTSKKAKPEEASPATVAESDAAATDVLQEEAEGSQATAAPEAEAEQQEPFIPKEVGINRFVWNFRYANATKIPGDKFSEFATAGPAVPPGRYQARLEIGDEQLTESFEIVKDPRVSAMQDDLQAQFELGMRVRDAMSQLNDAIIEIRDLREQLQGWEKRLTRGGNGETGDAGLAARTLAERLTGIEEELMNTKSASRMMYPPPNVPTRLNQRLAMLAGVIGSADARPTQQAYGVFEQVKQLIDAQLQALDELRKKDLAEFNERIRQLAVPAVVGIRERESVAVR